MILIKKIFFNLLLNSSLLIMLVVGIQNNSNKSRVNLLIDESVELPISFIVGFSFISGCFIGSFMNPSYIFKKN